MKHTLALLTTLLFASGGCRTELHAVDAPKTSKPNILFILADDLGIECLSSYGGRDHSTPNIDRLAAQGMQFSYCFSNPFCSPSRASLLTGRYPFKHGLVEVLSSQKQEDTYLSPEQPSFARQLKAAGYATAIAGKWHVSLLHKHNTINAFGFDQYQVWQIFDTPGNKTQRFWTPHINRNGTLLSEEIKEQYGPDLDVKFLTDFIATHAVQKKPFLAYFSTTLPHYPWEPTPDSRDSGYRIPHNESKGEAKYFPDMVRYLDKCVGKLLKALDDQGIADNTIVIFLADNGTDRDLKNRWGEEGKLLKGGKGTMTDRGTHVPLLVRWPNMIKAGTTCEDLIDFSDVLPTLCDMSGAPMPTEAIHGRSFYPQLLGKPGTPRTWVHVQHKKNRHVRDREFILNNANELRHVVETGGSESNPIQNKNANEVEQVARQRLQAVFDELGK